MRARQYWVVAGLILLGYGRAAMAADPESLMKKSGCFKCHSVDKKKDAPPYKEISTKYKGAADAEEELYTHLTTHPKVKVDGEEEEHDSLKTTDDADVHAVIQWILAR